MTSTPVSLEVINTLLSYNVLHCSHDLLDQKKVCYNYNHFIYDRSRLFFAVERTDGRAFKKILEIFEKLKPNAFNLNKTLSLLGLEVEV